MKNLKNKFAVLVVAVFMAIQGCKSNTQNKEDNLNQATQDVAIANEEAQIAKEELAVARQDSINTYQKYRAQVDARLIENERQITQIRANIKTQKASMRAQMNNDLDVLMQKNEDFKIEMKKQKDGAYDSWERFKDRFNSGLDDLGQSISAMAKSNQKE